MEYIIIGAELIIGIILGAFALAAAGAIIQTLFIALAMLYANITDFFEKRKNNGEKQ